MIGWGSTFGVIRAGARRVRESGGKVATAHLVHLNPFPRNTGEVLARYDRVLVPELNAGQLAMLLRARYLVDARSYSKVQGQPIFAEEILPAEALASSARVAASGSRAWQRVPGESGEECARPGEAPTDLVPKSPSARRRRREAGRQEVRQVREAVLQLGR